MSEILTSSPPRKLFIQMSGAPGSGKSTTANLLAPKIDAFVVPHDTIKSALLADDLVSFDVASKLTYRMDWALAEDIIKQGRNVIIDSTCNYKETLDEGQTLALKYGYAYWYVEIRADAKNLDLLDERLRKRTPLRAQRTGVKDCPRDAKEARHTQQDGHALFKNWIENPCRPEGGNIIVIHAESNLEERIYDILEQLMAGPVKEEMTSSPTATMA